jgi:hypothetical protein
MEYFISEIKNLVCGFFCVLENSNEVLYAILAFEGLLISIATPLLDQVVSRLQERFENKRIEEILKSMWQIRLFLVFICIHVTSLFVVLLLNTVLAPIMSYINVVYTFSSVFFLWWFFVYLMIIRNYSFNPWNKVKDRLRYELNKEIKRKLF